MKGTPMINCYLMILIFLDILLQRCYGSWGCFSIGEPFLSIYRPVNLFPLHPEVLDVKFYLKTRKNPDLFERLRPENNDSFTQHNFNPKQQTKFIIHGYLEHGHQKWIQVSDHFVFGQFGEKRKVIHIQKTNEEKNKAVGTL